MAGLAAAGDWEGQRRLRELADPDCDHYWLEALHPAHGAFLPPDECADAVRVRLGTGFTALADEPVPCAACDHGVLWPTCGHTLCCSPGLAPGDTTMPGWC